MSGQVQARRAAGIPGRHRAGARSIPSSRPPQAKGVRLESILDPRKRGRRRRSGAPAAGRLEPAEQRGEVHAEGRTGSRSLLQRVNSHVEFSVSDTGIGIPAAFLPHVFERFSQKDSSTNREYGGLGPRARDLQAAGGAARRLDPGEELGEGQGATFVVDAAAHHPGKGKGAGARRVHPTAAGLSDMVPVPRLDGVRVLVVDDEADALELIQRILEEQGARVTHGPVGRRSAAPARELARRTC